MIYSFSQELEDVVSSGVYQEQKLKGAVSSLSYRSQFISALIENLRSRFSSDAVILKSTVVASIRMWPLQSEKEKIRGTQIQLHANFIFSVFVM